MEKNNIKWHLINKVTKQPICNSPNYGFNGLASQMLFQSFTKLLNYYNDFNIYIYRVNKFNFFENNLSMKQNLTLSKWTEIFNSV